MNKILTVLLVTALVLSCQEKEKDLSQVSGSKLDRLAPYLQEISLQGFSGSVLVDYKGELFAKGYGSNNREASIPNTEETVYDIGSITKQFTAAGILKLEMMDKLSLGTTLSSYFENVPDDKKDITLHQLLSHSSGLIESVGNDYNAISETDFLNRVWGTDLLHASGSKYHYSNIGYSLLALILEKVSGQSYEQFLSEQLFKPAGMKHTGYSLPNWDPKTVAVGYQSDRALGRPNEQHWDGDEPYLHLKGNGGILSTVGDMYRWHQALLTDDLLNASAKEKYYHPHIKEDEDGRSHYGYGWVIVPTPRNTQLITHNGGNSVFFADMLRYLTEDITIILMSNSSSGHTERVAMQIAGLLLVEDFEPLLPEDMENELEESEIDDFVMDTFLAIRDGNPEMWESLLNEYASENFLNAVPMDTHFKYLEKIKKRLKDGKISGILVEDDEILTEVNTPTESLNLFLGFVETQQGELKLDGIQLEERK
ncbi:serine hydrolase [Aureisphaera galaxeae]|uniref:serine hydrolase domain-containing protein n=1 Tax=Aureisphaera galaxeae TaxID=1538023 RepID=UPI002350AC1B|nr:serine hydrolase domain-containing protein [Aureisphaera galaxeae]MDC8006189.1 serine hydrolase [Aureisphaera galaxeae]